MTLDAPLADVLRALPESFTCVWVRGAEVRWDEPRDRAADGAGGGGGGGGDDGGGDGGGEGMGGGGGGGSTARGRKRAGCSETEALDLTLSDEE